MTRLSPRRGLRGLRRDRRGRPVHHHPAGRGIGATASASPTPTSSSQSPGVGWLRPRLQYRWIGEPRRYRPRGRLRRPACRLGAGRVYLSGLNYVTSGLMGWSALTAHRRDHLDDRSIDGLVVRRWSAASMPMCSRPDHRVTMTAESEDCAARETAVSVARCPRGLQDQGRGCWATSSPAPSPSQYVAPINPGAVSARPSVSSRMRPDQYGELGGLAVRFALTPTEDYARETPTRSSSRVFHGISARRDRPATNQLDVRQRRADRCRANAEPPRHLHRLAAVGRCDGAGADHHQQPSRRLAGCRLWPRTQQVPARTQQIQPQIFLTYASASRTSAGASPAPSATS